MALCSQTAKTWSALRVICGDALNAESNTKISSSVHVGSVLASQSLLQSILYAVRDVPLTWSLSGPSVSTKERTGAFLEWESYSLTERVLMFTSVPDAVASSSSWTGLARSFAPNEAELLHQRMRWTRLVCSPERWAAHR